jgi:hypothetical protein
MNWATGGDIGRFSDERRLLLFKALFVLAGAAVALSGAPANARQYSSTIACSGWRDGQCVSWNRLTKEQAAKVAVGTVFGPHYSYYSEFNTIPQNVVTQYHLVPTNRYVESNGYIYVVDPQSYAVTQVITPQP